MVQILGTLIQEAERGLARAARKGDKSSVTGTKRLLRKLEKLGRESRRKNNGNVNVGYGASYALRVHENLEAHHKKGKKAKYLEDPFRELKNSGELQRVIDEHVANGTDLMTALVAAGQRVQRESQEEVPVKTGNLKGSAFTERE